MSSMPSVNEIMDHFMRLDPQACLRMQRPQWHGSKRWYVCLDSVFGASLNLVGSYSLVFGFSGNTPEEAVRNAWQEVLRLSREEENFLLCCKKSVRAEPQMWVRWNEEEGDWEDVEPAPGILELHNVPIDRIRSYRSRIVAQFM